MSKPKNMTPESKICLLCGDMFAPRKGGRPQVHCGNHTAAEKNRENNRRWAEKNRERSNQWNKENPLRAKEYIRRWRQNNPQRLEVYAARKQLDDNRKKAAAYTRQWRRLRHETLFTLYPIILNHLSETQP